MIEKVAPVMGMAPGEKGVKGDGRLHWRNVPKHAWLLLLGALGLLGLYLYFRTRPPKEDELKPIVIIDAPRFDDDAVHR